MAPWGSRHGLSNPPEPLNPGIASTRAISPRRALGPSQVTESDILQHAYGIPTLRSSPERIPRNPPPNPEKSSRHGRSRSNPFPSLFQSKKKQQGEINTAGSDFTDEENFMTSQFASSSKADGSHRAKASDKELMTGRCMTCDSMVRWPKDLHVFRCTVCLTINDLKPIGQVAPEAGSQQVYESTKRTPTSRFPPTNPVPLSLDKTSSLIEQCISSYILSRLKYAEKGANDISDSHLSSNVESGRGHNVNPGGIDSESGHTQRIPIRQTRGLDLSIGAVEIPISDFNSETHQLSTQYSRSTPGTYGRYSGEPLSESLPESTMSIGTRPGGGDFTRVSADHASKQSSIGQKMSIPSGDHRMIFRPLEDYIISSFTSHECINNSFSSGRPNLGSRANSEGTRQVTTTPGVDVKASQNDVMLSPIDAKALLVGDFAENGLWWTGVCDTQMIGRSRSHQNHPSSGDKNGRADLVTSRSPRIDWNGLGEWYRIVINAGHGWRRHLNNILTHSSDLTGSYEPQSQVLSEIEQKIMEAQAHTRRVLLKATETLLKRPGGLLKAPEDIRFLLILLGNPLLYSSSSSSSIDRRGRSRSRTRDARSLKPSAALESSNLPASSIPSSSQRDVTSGPGQHSGIIKRILGLLSNLSNECHHHIVGWFARFSEGHFKKTTELVGGFVTYRLTRQHGRKSGNTHDPSGGLIPSLAASGGSSAALHAALGAAGQPSKQSENKLKSVVYSDDWQIKAAARVMALLFSANNSSINRRHELMASASKDIARGIDLAARERAHRHGQILATSDFYNTLLDYSDLIADFEAWEAKRGKFAFCQYPFFLSIWAKIQIMEYDAKRQMEVKAREAFFDSIMSRKAVNQYLVLKVRRDCLVEDSLKGVSEVVGTGGEEIKKGLRIEFKGEEGIDAGGLRKEWFLLLVRDVFNPEHGMVLELLSAKATLKAIPGMFTYDEESRVCYFNPNTFETSDQFFLVGVVLGLAIYNSTILDVALPPFAFRKLLASGPTAPAGGPSHSKPAMTYSLDDLAEYRPTLASGLRQLLDYEGDVEATFCRDFVADMERYGQKVQVPLCANGEKRPVTNSNRREFVDLYVRYLLDTAVTRQFEPFKRGFFTVCGGNALSLFRPEEIELLIRGSDEPLDITSLQAVSICENWGISNPSETEPVISWFWESFRAASPRDQRKLLSFITGSDRIPAMGAANLVIKLSCLGDDSDRFPVARTCFNMLSMYRYDSRKKLESMLWRAVNESEGFGLK